jgi:hypothetical protein
LAQQFAFQTAAGIGLASEYAKYKNPSCDFDFTWLRAAMSDDPSRPDQAVSVSERKQLSSAAERALSEAEARRKAAAEANKAAAQAKPPPKEFQGPKGPEPTRYGDWENKGIASDF